MSGALSADSCDVRIVLLAVDDDYAGLMQAALYERQPGWIVGSVVSACRVYGQSNLGALWHLWRRSGLGYVMPMVQTKLVPWRRGRATPPSVLALRHGVPLLRSRDVNSARDLSWLRRLKPDVLVCTNFNHILRRQVLSLAPAGVWNLHKSALPEYRGMAPTFYALLDGRDEVGVTLHVIDEGIDTGPILAQRRLRVGSGQTVHEINCELSRLGGDLLATFLEEHRDLSVQPRPQPEGDWPTRSYPTRADVREFRRRGLRFI